MANRLLFAAVLLSLTCYAAWAQAPVGPEFQVNTYTLSNQYGPAVASDANGNFVVAWQSYRQDGNYSGIFGQRFNAAGLPRGSEFQVNSYATSYQSYPTVASDANGDFVVAWMSYGWSHNGVFGQRFNAVGLPQGTEFQVNSYTTGWQEFPAAASDANGNFVVVWTSWYQDGSDSGVFGRRFDASGVPLGSEFQVNSYTTSFQQSAAVASDPNGNFVVVWQSWFQDGSYWGVFGQRFSAAGLAQGSEFRVNSYTQGAQDNPAVASAANGDFIVVWTSDSQDGSGWGVFGQRFDASGVPRGRFRVNSYTTDHQFSPSVAADANGDFVVVWTSFRQDGSLNGIFGRRFDAFLVRRGAEFQVNSYTPSTQNDAAAASAANGNFVVAWNSDGQDGDSAGVFGQRYSIDQIFKNGFE